MARSIFQIQNSVDLAISEGLIEGIKHFAKFGYNANLSLGVEAVLWPGPTVDYVFPSDNGEPMEIQGGNISDNQTIAIFALDENWNEKTISVILNGTTPVPIPGLISRINRAIKIGPTDILGDATIRPLGGGVTFALVLALEQVTTQMIFSVPDGFKAQLETPFVAINKSGGAGASVIFRYRIRNFGQTFITAVRFGLNKSGTTASPFLVGKVTPLEPRSDTILLALADANNTDASARIPFTLYKV